MSRQVEYYFSMLSPWAFIGHDAFMEIIQEYKLNVAYRPMSLGRVFEETGGLPLARRHPVRQRYRFVELQRWREKRGLDFRLQPKFWPFDVNLADRIVCAIVESGQDPAPFMARCFRAIWHDERNMADEAELAGVLEAVGMKGDVLIKAARDERIGALYDRNCAYAIEQGYFGSPCYVLDGEPFWGQDRLDLLVDALKSGRAPYLPPAA
jgi:2-hydroxychromene-2-carboxylate isomerase